MIEKKFAVATKAIVYYEGKFLVLFKSDAEDVNPNSYDVPGGRIEFGENLSDAVKREVQEEAGLDVQVLEATDAWSFMKDENTQLVGITYATIANSGKVKLSEEHSRFEWLSYEEVVSATDRLPEWIINSVKMAQIQLGVIK